MEKKENKFHGPLYFWFGVIQLELRMKKTHHLIQETNKKELKKGLLAISPIIIGLILFIVTKKTFPMLIGLWITSINNVALKALEFKKLKKKEKEILNNLKNRDEKQTQPQKILTEDMFFSETLKAEIEKEETNIVRKYREELERRRDNLSLLKNKVEKTPTKENQTADILDEIELLKILYNLPPINIELEEWNIYLDVIYDKLIEKGEQEHYKEITLIVCNRAISKALINNQELISINDFIESLSYFEVNEYKPCNLFERKELLQLQRKIATEINTLKEKELKLC